MLAKTIEEVFHPQEAGDLTSIITKDETTLRIVSKTGQWLANMRKVTLRRGCPC